MIMIKKYKKRPVVIEALQFNGSNFDEVSNFLGYVPEVKYSNDEKEPIYIGLYIETLEGKMFASLMDYIIKGISNEFYPCKPEIFKEIYEDYFEKKVDDYWIGKHSKPKYELLDMVIFDNDLTGQEECQGIILEMAKPIDMIPAYVIEYSCIGGSKAGVFIEGLIKGLYENKL